MTKPNEAGAEVVRRRKATVWTRKKVTQLIELYKQHDCLWNHYTEAYKNKERRSKAIDDICASLRITKLDFGRKIHNLRSQFNSEMKKLERRIEETGGATDVNVDATGCRWKHFESLRFLRNVIEPRPGAYQVGNLSQAKLRRVESRLKFDYASEEDVEQHTNTASSGSRNADVEDVTEYHFEETTTVDDDEPLAGDQVGTDGFQQYDIVEEGTPIPGGPEIYDRKYNPRISPSVGQQTVSTANLTQPQAVRSSKTYLPRIHQVQQHKPHQQRSETIHLGDTQPISTSIVELVTTGSTVRVDQRAQLSSPASPPSSKQPEKTAVEFKARDQWDAFGELIASEFRHLTSDLSRKKLKRKIMQAMLEVGEEDDSVAV